MLYDGAIKALRKAISAIEDGNIPAKGEQIGKATDIIIELNSVLDMDAGGEIATDLRRLYEFMISHLTQAHIKNDQKMIGEVITLLEDINQSWRAIAT